MKVEWLRRAARELDAQLDFLEDRNPSAALNAAIAIEAATETIGDHPLIGRIGRVATTREYVVTGTPFLFVYRVEPSKIVILRLLHTAQNYP
jgi:plasmid stabilization system protein ParE